MQLYSLNTNKHLSKRSLDNSLRCHRLHKFTSNELATVLQLIITFLTVFLDDIYILPLFLYLFSQLLVCPCFCPLQFWSLLGSVFGDLVDTFSSTDVCLCLMTKKLIEVRYVEHRYPLGLSVILNGQALEFMAKTLTNVNIIHRGWEPVVQ